MRRSWCTTPRVRRRSFVKFPHNADSGSEQLVIPPKNFTERDRLATVVPHIEEDCQVVPFGALKLLPTHELIKNPAFRGLKIDEGGNLEHYLHFRKPHSKEKKPIIRMESLYCRFRSGTSPFGLPRPHQ